MTGTASAHRRIAIAVLAGTCLCGSADASLYTLDSETFDQRFTLPDDGFRGPASRFALPFEDDVGSAAFTPREHESRASYLTQALHSTSANDDGAGSTGGPSASLASLQNGLSQSPAQMMRIQATALANPGTYQGNLWTLMTASLNGPSGNSLLGFAQANFSNVPFEPPASVPLPNSAVLFAAALLSAAGWSLLARRR